MPSAHRRRRDLRRCAYRNILAKVQNQRVVFLEHRVGSLAVCMPHMDKQFSNYDANDLSLNGSTLSDNAFGVHGLTVKDLNIRNLFMIKSKARHFESFSLHLCSFEYTNIMELTYFYKIYSLY